MQHLPWGDMSLKGEHADGNDYAGYTAPDHSADAGLNDGRRVTIRDGVAPQCG